jgi:hypothetical protein
MGFFRFRRSFRIAPGLLAALLWAGAAGAARCDKIEYAEAKDWKIEQVERTYCEYFRSAKDAIDLRTSLYNIGTSPQSAKYKSLSAEAEGCFEAAAGLGRVIKNVHGRPFPTCN